MLFLKKHHAVKTDKYDKIAKQLDVCYVSGGRRHKGRILSLSPEDVIQTYNSIHPCSCGNLPTVYTYNLMGDFSAEIGCRKCGYSIEMSMYEDKDYLKKSIQKWNEKQKL